MRKFIGFLGVVGALSLATMASATTTFTWSFGSDPTQISNGQTYSGSNGGGTITVFGEEITNTQDSHGNNTGGTYYNGTAVSGLFSTDTAYFNEGTGIAPYNPNEGTSPQWEWNGSSWVKVPTFSSQDGITDEVNNNNPTYGNILVLELGSNIAEGTTLNFLLQAGNGQSGDAVSIFYQDATGTPSNPPDVSPDTFTSDGTSLASRTTPANSITNTGTTPQLSMVKDTNGIEFVAIEADCHYLLLDTITGTPGTSGVPEPRFYGLLLASLLGLGGVVYQRRRAAQSNV